MFTVQRELDWVSQVLQVKVYWSMLYTECMVCTCMLSVNKWCNDFTVYCIGVLSTGGF